MKLIVNTCLKINSSISYCWWAHYTIRSTLSWNFTPFSKVGNIFLHFIDVRIRVSEAECSVQNVKLESDRCSPQPLQCLASKLLQFPSALPWSMWQGPDCALVLRLAAEPTAGHLLGPFLPGKKVPLTGCLLHIAKNLPCWLRFKPRHFIDCG